MGCTPAKPHSHTNERFVNALVYHIHSSAPPKSSDANQIKIIQCVRERGHWIAGLTGGGCRNNVEMFALNPQYQMTVLSPGFSEVLIGLSQDERSSVLLPIGIHVYKTEFKNQRLAAEYLLCVQPEFTSGDYRPRPQVWALGNLASGHYTVIVSTYRASSAKFELVFYSCAQIQLRKLINLDV
ncbi:hypothetical protein M8J76_004597 [Diaphorina citri]|nr:hypothetical protein M8J76_004597 [Diaphorina citri]